MCFTHAHIKSVSYGQSVLGSCQFHARVGKGLKLATRNSRPHVNTPNVPSSQLLFYSRIDRIKPTMYEIISFQSTALVYVQV